MEFLKEYPTINSSRNEGSLIKKIKKQEEDWNFLFE